MTFFQVIILSIVEGITEFLPVSSTGHLILTAKLLSIPQTEFVKSFEIIIQLGAILAVVVLYWKRLMRDKSTWLKISTAFLPTGILGFILYKLIKEYLIGNEFVTVSALLIGGLVLIAIEVILKDKAPAVLSLKDLSLKKAFGIGFFQAFSMIPGVSRAAATIIGGQLLGLSRKEAVEFSFLLAVPTMAAATGLDLIENNFRFTSAEYWLLITGFLCSFLVAALTISVFIRYIQHHTFIAFGIYRIFIAILFLLIYF